VSGRRALGETRRFQKQVGPMQSLISEHHKNLAKGIAAHLAGKPTPPDAHQAMIALHCKTLGRSTHRISSLLSFHQPFRYRTNESDIFGHFDDKTVAPIVGTIKDQGLTILPMRLPKERVDRLVEFAKTTPAHLGGGVNAGNAIFDPSKPAKARIYDFSSEQCYRNADVQDVMADPLLISIAGQYLGVNPIIDGLSMWWSPVCQTGDPSDAAQLYHFDMDRPRWLKLFVYLTDVDETGGPHVYVRKSHRVFNEKVAKLLSRGYVRIPDSEIVDAYGADAAQPVCAPAGTIFVADTVGFHKGLPPTQKPRLVLELSYATSLFGAETLHAGAPAQLTPAMRRARALWPRAFKLFAA
jgi:hypothetical protein